MSQRNMNFAFKTVMVTGYLLLVSGAIVLIVDPQSWKLALMEIAGGLCSLRIVYRSDQFQVLWKKPFTKRQ